MGTLKIERLDNKKLTPLEHVREIQNSVMNSLSNSELGVYRNVTLDIDDLWKLLGNVQQLQRDVDFLLARKSENDRVTQELAALNDNRVKEILTKVRVIK